jgi:hypothetical protein
MSLLLKGLPRADERSRPPTAGARSLVWQHSAHPESGVPGRPVRSRHRCVGSALQKQLARSAYVSSGPGFGDRRERRAGGRSCPQAVTRRGCCGLRTTALPHQQQLLVVGAETAALVLAVRGGAANDAAGRAAGRRLMAALPGASGCLAATSGQSRSRSEARVFGGALRTAALPARTGISASAISSLPNVVLSTLLSGHAGGPRAATGDTRIASQTKLLGTLEL